MHAMEMLRLRFEARRKSLDTGLLKDMSSFQRRKFWRAKTLEVLVRVSGALGLTIRESPSSGKLIDKEAKMHASTVHGTSGMEEDCNGDGTIFLTNTESCARRLTAFPPIGHAQQRYTTLPMVPNSLTTKNNVHPPPVARQGN